MNRLKRVLKMKICKEIKKLKYLLPLFLFLSFKSIAQNSYLVKNIPVTTNASNPRHFGKLNNEVFFFADDGIHGNELWKTDGTSAGTVLVKDINPNGNGINNHIWDENKFISIQNVLYFAATDNNSNYRTDDLWRTDGTATGTYKVKSFNLGSFDYTPEKFTNLNDVLYFRIGKSLWKSDGTEAGTIQLTTTVSVENLMVYHNKLYFDVRNGSWGYDLWSSDGTVAGTKLFNAFNGNTLNSEKVIFKDKLYVIENHKVWLTDGTEAGTIQLQIPPNDTVWDPVSLRVFKDELFIGSCFPGSTLWKTDGTSNGTVKLRTFNTKYSIGAENFTEANGILYFTAADSLVGIKDDGLSRSLWKTDGTLQGTEFLSAINPTNGFLPNLLTAFKNSLLLAAYDDKNGYELWKSEGTPATTALVKNIYPGNRNSTPSSFTILNDKLIFSADDGANKRELWISDGTAAGTKLLMDINKIKNGNVHHLTNVNDQLFFSASTTASADQLWKSDGTDAGTKVVAEVAPIDGLGFFAMEELNGYAYFLIDDTVSRSFYRSDGTAAGTQVINRAGYYGDVKKIGKYLYGTSPDFWISDGTTAGSTFIGLGNMPVNRAELFKDKMYFSSSSSVDESDGTIAGTKTFVNFKRITDIAATDQYLFLSADSSFSDNCLWKSDGTMNGFTMLKKVNAYNLTNVNGTIYFSGTTDTGIGSGLWKSDGTPEGTVMVKNINPAGGSIAFALKNINGMLYFIANDGVTGNELWRSDGTEAGTVLVKDIYPGTSHAFTPSKDSIPNFIYNNGLIYFSANDGTHGYELWKSDGTDKGTTLYSDINPNGSSYPQELTISNQNLFYTAYEDKHGWSLWSSGSLKANSCFAYFKTEFDKTQNKFILTIDSATYRRTSSYLWDFGDGSTSTLIEPTHTYLKDGVYNLCLKAFSPGGNSCIFCHEIGKDSLGNIIRASGFELVVKKDPVLGINVNESKATHFLIFPNPALQQLSIVAEQPMRNAVIHIMSVEGKLLIEKRNDTGNRFDIDVTTLSKGMYLIEIIYPEGVIKEKFIKE